MYYYCWGHSKQRFRSTHNSHNSKDLVNDIYKTFSSDIEELPQERVFRYSRMARDYIRGYQKIKDYKAANNTNDENYVTKELIERMKKTYKAHRNILDMCSSFLKDKTFSRVLI